MTWYRPGAYVPVSQVQTAVVLKGCLVVHTPDGDINRKANCGLGFGHEAAGWKSRL
jgi:hypothetical protein